MFRIGDKRQQSMFMIGDRRLFRQMAAEDRSDRERAVQGVWGQGR